MAEAIGGGQVAAAPFCSDYVLTPSFPIHAGPSRPGPFPFSPIIPKESYLRNPMWAWMERRHAISVFLVALIPVSTITGYWFLAPQEVSVVMNYSPWMDGKTAA